MKYGILFIITGVLCLIYANLIGGITWILAWPALSFTLVGVAYLKSSPKLFGKQKNGRVLWLAKLLLFPYLLLLSLVWHVYRLLSSEGKFNQINEQLWIGRRLLAHEYDPRFEMIIDLTCEFTEPNEAMKTRDYKTLPILDADIPCPEQTQNLLTEIKRSKKKIYIHCAQGHGRTGLLASLLLLEWKVVKTSEEALQLLQSKRPKLRINSKQKEFISQYFHERMG